LGIPVTIKGYSLLEEQIIRIMIDTKPKHSFRCLFRSLEIVTSSAQIHILLAYFFFANEQENFQANVSVRNIKTGNK
jgi:hypothetical protein